MVWYRRLWHWLHDPLGLQALRAKTIQLETKLTDYATNQVHLAHRLWQLDETLQRYTRGGADVHFKSPTQLVILSKLGHGYVKIIDLRIDHLQELQDLVRAIEAQYGVRIDIYDAPFPMSRYLQERRDWR